MIIRIVYIFTFSFGGKYGWMMYILWAKIGSLLMITLKPYKENWFNIFDGLSLSLLGFVYVGTLYNTYVANISSTIICIVVTVPLIYFTIYIICKILLQTKLLQSRHCCWKILVRVTAHYDINQLAGNEQDDSDFPHRLLNPEEYRNTQNDLEADVNNTEIEYPTLKKKNPTYGAI